MSVYFTAELEQQLLSFTREANAGRLPSENDLRFVLWPAAQYARWWLEGKPEPPVETVPNRSAFTHEQLTAELSGAHTAKEALTAVANAADMSAEALWNSLTQHPHRNLQWQQLAGRCFRVERSCCVCGRLMGAEDFDSAVCPSCASFDNKLGAVSLELQLTAKYGTGNVGKIHAWRIVRDLVRRIFGEHYDTDQKIYDRLCDWLQREYENRREELTGPWPSGGLESLDGWLLRARLPDVIRVLETRNNPAQEIQRKPPAGYLDEIYAAESEWWQAELRAFLADKGRITGTSRWHHVRDKLAEIDRRYGITPDDPRVYSIAAYKNERQNIESRAPYFQGAVESRHWHGCAVDDLDARHFGRIKMEYGHEAESRRHLWAHITKCAIPLLETLPKSRDDSLRSVDPELQRVYSALHDPKLQVLWAESPPYPPLTRQETIDKLWSIANRLEINERLPHYLPPEEFARVASDVVDLQRQGIIEPPVASQPAMEACAHSDLMEFDANSLPAAYREGGKADGLPLVVPYLAESIDWKLTASALAGARRDQRVRSVKVRIGGKLKDAHEFTSLAAYRLIKTRREDGER
jgi:hypothetical protein